MDKEDIRSKKEEKKRGELVGTPPVTSGNNSKITTREQANPLGRAKSKKPKDGNLPWSQQRKKLPKKSKHNKFAGK